MKIKRVPRFAASVIAAGLLAILLVFTASQNWMISPQFEWPAQAYAAPTVSMSQS
jgi:hypothetical protein